MNFDLNELSAMSRDWGPKSVADNYYDTHVLHKSMKARQMEYPGGENIRLQLMVAGDPNDETGRAMDFYGTWDFRNPELFTAARFEPKMDVQIITVWDHEIAINGTSEVQYADLIKNRQAAYTQIFADRMSRYLYGRGQGGVRINGLEDIFDNNSTFGKIDRSKTDIYNAFVFNHTQKRNLTRRLIGQSMTSVTDGPTKPDIILTSSDIWDLCEDILKDFERYPNTLMAQAGFDNMTYRGVPIVYDKNMPVKTRDRHQMYFLNFDYWKWYICRGFNMARRPWRRMPNNAGQYEVLVTVGNTCSDNLRYQSMLDDLDPFTLAAAA